jgi:regulation of enolase protein 1 (concanavalin A-like superfamily)
MHNVAWESGRWLNPPLAVSVDGADLLVTTRDQTDFWRTTSYGYVHDDGHALLTDLPVGSAVEVSLVLPELNAQYDQAGALLWVDAQTWMKAPVEFTNGVATLGAVVTHGLSDWSVAPAPGSPGDELSIRMSRAADAVSIRARFGTGEWQLIRLAPLSGSLDAAAGPFCCSPTREGLQVRFTGWRIGPADIDPE